MSEEITNWHYCRNEKCSSQRRKHVDGEICDYTVTGSCEVCNKPLWERDRSYSVLKFGRVVCPEHSEDRYWTNYALEKKGNTQEQAEFLENNKLEDIPF